MTSEQITTGRYSTVRKLPTLPEYENAELSEGGIRWWIFNAETNGFDDCILRVGSKLLIILPRFDKWLESHRCGRSE